MNQTTHEYETCPRCKGVGEIPHPTEYFSHLHPVPCPICDGTGRVIKSVTIITSADDFNPTL